MMSFIELTEDQKQEIEQIKSGMECPKDFVCYKSGFRKVCEAELIAGGKLLECLEPNSLTRKFALPFGRGVFCECPLRFYAAKNLRV